MKIRLRIDSPGSETRLLELAPGTHDVGSAEGEVRLAYPTVSRAHGVITVSEGVVRYLDRGSRNGSYLGPEATRLSPDAAVDWPSGSHLRIGPFTLSWAPDDARRSSGEPPLLEAAERYERLLTEDPAGARERLCVELGASSAGPRLWELIHDEFHGDGPLKKLLVDQACREILLNAHDEIYADTGEGLRRLPARFLKPETYQAWAVRTAQAAGRRLDLQNPICEATLPGGARFHAVLAPLSSRGLSVAIRRFGAAPITEEAALATGWLDARALALIEAAVREKKNIVISGGTSTGKTSLLNFLCRYLDRAERVITVEDTVELSPPVENLVQLQARGANADGIGQVSLRQLVQCALRMRPDRIVVGECRGAEVLEMLQALNTGHPGSLTTVHANSTGEAIQRLELLALLGAPNLSIECIREWISSSVELVIQVERSADGHRHVAAIATNDGQRGGYRTVYERSHRQMAKVSG